MQSAKIGHRQLKELDIAKDQERGKKAIFDQDSNPFPLGVPRISKNAKKYDQGKARTMQNCMNSESLTSAPH